MVKNIMVFYLCISRMNFAELSSIFSIDRPAHLLIILPYYSTASTFDTYPRSMRGDEGVVESKKAVCLFSPENTVEAFLLGGRGLR